MKKHNGFISLWKFIYCIVIMLYHVRYFAESGEKYFFDTGYIVTEFFFMVSGFFLAKKCYSFHTPSVNLGEETFSYIWNKIKVFFPFILLAHILGLIILVIFENIDVYEVVISIYSLCLLQMSGIKSFYASNVPVWYLSAMLFSMLVIYPLCRKYKDTYSLVVAPTCGILLLGYLAQKYSSLNLTVQFDGIFFSGLIRAFAEINLGVVAFKGTEALNKKSFSHFAKIGLSMFSIISFVIPLYVTNFIEKAVRYDYVIVMFLLLGIMVSSSVHCFNSNLLNNKFIYYLEKLSFPIYVNHYFIRKLFEYIFNSYIVNYYIRITLFILITICFSIIQMYIFDSWKKYYKGDILL